MGRYKITGTDYLVTIQNLGVNAYSWRIRGELEKLAERTVSIGEVYVALEQLEEEGLIVSRLQTEGSRPKRLYVLTRQGTAMVMRYGQS